MIQRLLPVALFCLGLLFAGGTARSGGVPRSSTPRKFSVGLGAPRVPGGVIRRGATAPGGTLTVSRVAITVNSDGSQIVQLIYTNAAGGNVSMRTLNIDSGCTHVLDNLGNVVSATGPTAECSAATSFATQVDTTIGNAATGGKLNL